MSKTISLGEKLIKLCSKQVFAWRKGQISSLPLALTGLAYLEWWRRRSVHSSMSLLSRSKATSTSHSSLMASMMVVMPCLCTQSTSCSVWTGGWGRWPLVRLLLVSCDGQRAADVAGGWLWAPVSAILRLFHLKSTQFNSHLTRTVDRLSLPGRAHTCTSLIIHKEWLLLSLTTLRQTGHNNSHFHILYLK